MTISHVGSWSLGAELRAPDGARSHLLAYSVAPTTRTGSGPEAQSGHSAGVPEAYWEAARRGASSLRPVQMWQRRGGRWCKGRLSPDSVSPLCQIRGDPKFSLWKKKQKHRLREQRCAYWRGRGAVGWTRRPGLTHRRMLLILRRALCRAQGTLLSALSRPRSEGNPNKTEHVYTCSCFTLL